MKSPDYPEVVERLKSLETTVVVLQTQVASLVTLVQSMKEAVDQLKSVPMKEAVHVLPSLKEAVDRDPDDSAGAASNGWQIPASASQTQTAQTVHSEFGVVWTVHGPWICFGIRMVEGFVPFASPIRKSVHFVKP